jgi:hypothetical protein
VVETCQGRRRRRMRGRRRRRRSLKVEEEDYREEEEEEFEGGGVCIPQLYLLEAISARTARELIPTPSWNSNRVRTPIVQSSH